MRAMKGCAVTVGIHETAGSLSKEAPGKSESSGLDLIDVATAHELGIGTPRRSFIGDFVDVNEAKLKSDMLKVAEAAVRNKTPPEQALARFGLYCAGQIKQRIADGIEPELTAERKREKERLTGSPKDTPLILTGQLRSSIDSQVVPSG